MQANMFIAEKVISGSQVGRYGGVDFLHVDNKWRVCVRCATILVDLEPYVATGYPGIDVLTIRHAGHVKNGWPGVSHACTRGEAEACPCSNSLNSSGWTTRLLIAPHQIGGDILDWAGLRIVGSLAHILPIVRSNTIYNGFGEEV